MYINYYIITDLHHILHNTYYQVVWIFETKLVDFYHSEFSDCCLHLYCYIHVSSDMSSGLLQMFCWTQESTRNFEPCPLFNPRGSPVLIPLTITGSNRSVSKVLICYVSSSYRHWFPKLLKRQSSGGCRFNPDCRLVTIQEYLALIPSYG